MCGSRRIAGLALALCVGTGSGASGVVTVYRATGFADSTEVATSVTCHNLGPGSSDIGVRFYDGNGALVCAVNRATVAVGATETISSRVTGLLYEHAVCATPPAALGGRLEVEVDNASTQHLPCTLRLVAPSGTQPAFALLLPFYSRNWIPLADSIFESGFEGASTVDWSARVP